jgi:hypothetical protein
MSSLTPDVCADSGFGRSGIQNSSQMSQGMVNNGHTLDGNTNSTSASTTGHPNSFSPDSSQHEVNLTISSGKRSAEPTDDHGSPGSFHSRASKAARFDEDVPANGGYSPGSSSSRSTSGFSDPASSNGSFKSPAEISFWNGPLNESKRMILNLFPADQLVNLIFSNYGEIQINLPGIKEKISCSGMLSRYKEAVVLSADLKKAQDFNKSVSSEVESLKEQLKVRDFKIADLNLEKGVISVRLQEANGLAEKASALHETTCEGLLKEIDLLRAEVNEVQSSKDKIENQLRFSCQKRNELEVSLQSKNEKICSLALTISKLEIKSKSDNESLTSKTESLSQSEHSLSAAQAEIKRLNAVISCSQIQVSAEKDVLIQQLEVLKEKNERISNFIQMFREQSCSLMPADGERNISNTSGPNTSETGTPTASTSIVNVSYSGAKPTYKSSTPNGGDSKKNPPFLGNLSANEKENLEIPKARRPGPKGDGTEVVDDDVVQCLASPGASDFVDSHRESDVNKLQKQRNADLFSSTESISGNLSDEGSLSSSSYKSGTNSAKKCHRFSKR